MISKPNRSKNLNYDNQHNNYESEDSKPKTRGEEGGVTDLNLVKRKKGEELFSKFASATPFIILSVELSCLRKKSDKL